MSKIINYTKGGFTVTTDKGKINIDTLYNSLHRLYWATNRSKETIVKSIENSLCFSMFKGDKQIGFARVITDYATFAYLCDVYIDEDYRGNGLGIWLLECILNYPDLLELRKWLLATKDAHELYRKFGFSELATPERYMEIVN
ncbi:GNAT family N-acetyltransferase [Clostridium tunisiense]|uniref:GNAT family N-acetyltransferase n=1 Tax=Clostridium tunisiense TaxID=219748 RepID=UPI0002FE889A|nr:GNAT family N-acetyltransferase [Clostridium tunisiense]